MSLIAQEVLICHFCNEPITKMNGLDPDSLVNHHITYIPEVIVPTHRICHARYHGTHPDHPKNPEGEYRKRFIEGLDGDVICYFCNEPITKMNGADPDSLLIHSLDGNHDNWEPSNKTPTHRGCHTKYHAAELWADPDYRARLSSANKEGQFKFQEKPEARVISQERARRAWETRYARYGLNGFSDRPRKKRCKTDRDRARLGERCRWGYAWKRLAQMFEMLFGDIVDGDVETFTCPHCNRVFSKIGWLRRHISIQHESRESDELELLNVMVKRVENGENRDE